MDNGSRYKNKNLIKIKIKINLINLKFICMTMMERLIVVDDDGEDVIPIPTFNTQQLASAGGRLLA